MWMTGGITGYGVYHYNEGETNLNKGWNMKIIDFHSRVDLVYQNAFFDWMIWFCLFEEEKITDIKLYLLFQSILVNGANTKYRELDGPDL